MHQSFMQDFNPYKAIVGLLGCGMAIGMAITFGLYFLIQAFR